MAREWTCGKHWGAAGAGSRSSVWQTNNKSYRESKLEELTWADSRRLCFTSVCARRRHLLFLTVPIGNLQAYSLGDPGGMGSGKRTPSRRAKPGPCANEPHSAVEIPLICVFVSVLGTNSSLVSLWHSITAQPAVGRRTLFSARSRSRRCTFVRHPTLRPSGRNRESPEDKRKFLR